MIAAIRYAREHDIPYLGLCYGLQLAVIEYARNVAGVTEATSEEFDADSEWKVICVQDSQKSALEQKSLRRQHALGRVRRGIQKRQSRPSGLRGVGPSSRRCPSHRTTAGQSRSGVPRSAWSCWSATKSP